MKSVLITLAAAGLGLAVLPAAHADDASWVVRFGAHDVVPKSNNGTLAGMKTKIDSDTKPTASVEYLATPNIGVELLVAAPFRHEVRLNGTPVAVAHQLPPVLGVNYHFMPDNTVSPFLGLGLNYTRFFDIHARGPLTGTRVRIASSWGAAAHAGVDVKISPSWIITADVRWIDIGSDVHVNGAKVGHASINPLAYGVSVGYRF
jgi:outer membrane protein